jgi:hypothetical protein
MPAPLNPYSTANPNSFGRAIWEHKAVIRRVERLVYCVVGVWLLAAFLGHRLTFHKIAFVLVLLTGWDLLLQIGALRYKLWAFRGYYLHHRPKSETGKRIHRIGFIAFSAIVFVFALWGALQNSIR